MEIKITNGDENLDKGLNKYKLNMIKKIILLCFLFVFPITSCSNLSEINEKAKGDGIPYIPGI